MNSRSYRSRKREIRGAGPVIATSADPRVGKCATFTPPRAANGFTLVELLAAIAIITVLIAILLPVIKGAWQQAKTVQCASNQRQVLQGIMLYAAENRGVLPIPLPPVDPWPFNAIQNVRTGQYSFTKGTLWLYVSSDVQVRQRIFLCPADAPDGRFAMSDNTVSFQPNPNLPRNFSYNLNGNLEVRAGVRITQIRRPSNKVLVVEMTAPNCVCGGPAVLNFDWDPKNPSGGPPVLVLLSKRHQGHANEGFADGHVEAIDPDIFGQGSVWAYGQTSSTPAYNHYFDLFADW